jgi:toxin ParE1/3/4
LKYRLRYLPAAEQDIRDGYDYLLTAGGEMIANRYIEDMLTACAGLRDFPLRGGPRSKIRPGLRILIVKRSVTIAYAVSGNEVTVLRILGRGRDLGEAFGVDETTEA